jgi:EAL domain-containing protein (putative c-di-GMP-specific phosphodiesterase class I)
VSPAEFIPLAEESGLIHDLGRRVLREACAQGKLWAESNVPVRISVNVSPIELQHEMFVWSVQDTLRRTGLPPRLLELEVTESAAMSDLSSGIERLNALSALGVTIAIDDFGTGYSSLSYLRQLPAQVIKIDRSFVRDLGVNSGASARDEAIVRAIVTLAHGVGKRVVAEGVETQEQRGTLLGLGCEEAQGYLFSCPVDARALTALLRSGATV